MYFLFAFKHIFNSFLCLVFLRSFHLFVDLRWRFCFFFKCIDFRWLFCRLFDFPLIEFALNGFLVEPYSYWDSEKRHVYC